MSDYPVMTAATPESSHALDTEKTQDTISMVGYVVRSNYSLPSRVKIIEALLVAELFTMGPSPAVSQHFDPWFTINIRPFAIQLLSAVNEDHPIDIDTVLSMVHTAYFGVYQQMNTTKRDKVMQLLIGVLTPSLPKAHIEAIKEWNEHGFRGANK